MPSVLEYSTFIRIVMLRSGLTEPHSELTSTLAREPDTYYGDDFRLQKVHDRYPSGIFEEVTAAEMLRINKPIYFKRNIENLVVLAHRWDIEAVIATFAYSPLFEDRPLVFSEEYRAAFREMNETLVEIAEETDTHLFDFAAVFPQSKEYYKDGRHVNAKGQKLKVELFARYLIENGLLPAPS